MIALIIPSERALCPYVELYTTILDQIEVAYIIIEWDRLHRNGNSKLRYRAPRIGAQMGLLEYMGYARFSKKVLEGEHIESIIVFSLPLLFALNISGGLRNRHYGLDIRDYHRSYSLPFTKRAVARAKFCAISSPGYSAWLSSSVKPTISHNAYGLVSKPLKSAQDARSSINQSQRKIMIGTIGQLKDLKVNEILLDHLGNDEKYQLVYHGEGVVEGDLQEICNKRGLSNITFTGRYQPCQEPELYAECDAISMLMTPGTVNNDTLMANRVYNSALYGVPQIAFAGTYLSKVVTYYRLGIVIESPDHLHEIDRLLAKFYDNMDDFEAGRLEFAGWVQDHQQRFKVDLLSFLSHTQVDGNP